MRKTLSTWAFLREKEKRGIPWRIHCPKCGHIKFKPLAIEYHYNHYIFPKRCLNCGAKFWVSEPDTAAPYNSTILMEEGDL